MKLKFSFKGLIVSLLIALFTVFFNGIHMNSQQGSGFNTYSGGFPFTFFEYYCSTDEVNIISLLKDLNYSNYKIDILPLILNIICIYLFLKYLLKIIHNINKIE